MDNFDKRMAAEVIEDAFMDLHSPYSRGVASGLCGAFYMCGLLNEEEWKACLKRIPAELFRARGGGNFAEPKESTAMDRDRFLN